MNGTEGTECGLPHPGPRRWGEARNDKDQASNRIIMTLTSTKAYVPTPYLVVGRMCTAWASWPMRS